MGVLCFSLGITGKVAGSCMIANAFFNVYVLCKVPGFLPPYLPTSLTPILPASYGPLADVFSPSSPTLVVPRIHQVPPNHS